MIMKEKLSLMKLNEMYEHEIKSIKGGQAVSCCSCACAYVNCNGSSSKDNRVANTKKGFHSAPIGPAC
jgi:natural product precursor